MEERKIDLSALGLLAGFLTALRKTEIPFFYFQDEEDNSFFCECEIMSIHGIGDTFDEAVNDLVENLREVSETYCEQIPFWVKTNPEALFYALKICTSSNEEILQCLNGKPYEDF